MALFTLTDIDFGENRREGAASPTLVGPSYDYNTYRFPSDIGNYNRGHYIVFHINAQAKSEYNYATTNDRPTITQNAIDTGNPTVGQMVGAGLSGAAGIAQSGLQNVSKDITGWVGDVSNFLNGLTGGAAGNLIGNFGSALKNYTDVENARNLKRTTDTIALYMPDTVNFITNQQYAELQTTGTAALGLSAAASYADELKKSGGSNKMAMQNFAQNNMSPFIASYLLNEKNVIGNLGKQMFAASYGMVQNPMLDIIYSSPAFREFNFEFVFYPKSEEESLSVQKIIQRLQFHQAPEVKQEFNGFFLVPPSEFDIKFYYNGAENPNIQKISTCVLQSINIDYAPNGFSAYEVPGQIKPTLGGTGSPVAYRVNLTFKETEIMTKRNFIDKDCMSLQSSINRFYNLPTT